MRKHRILTTTLAAVAFYATTAALACVNLDPPVVSSLETAPCTASATSSCLYYSVCPPNESCSGWYATGYDTCPITLITTVSCDEYQGGTPIVGSLCCENGTPTGHFLGNISKSFVTPAGVCSWWAGEPGDEN